jgi:hypothetical protein
MRSQTKEITSKPQENLTAMRCNMRPTEAAFYTGLSESKLAKLRMCNNRAKGPNFLKISGCVVYRRSDLDRWMDSHSIDLIS